jgi:hypothetical protein
MADAAAPEATAAEPTEAVSKKRAAPVAVKPVVHAGVRYATRRAGWVRAVQVDSGELLWEVQVYGLQGNPDLEDDKREVDITSLRLDARRQHLLVRNARGQRYTVDLATRAVRAAR